MVLLICGVVIATILGVILFLVMDRVMSRKKRGCNSWSGPMYISTDRKHNPNNQEK